MKPDASSAMQLQSEFPPPLQDKMVEICAGHSLDTAPKSKPKEPATGKPGTGTLHSAFPKTISIPPLVIFRDGSVVSQTRRMAPR